MKTHKGLKIFGIIVAVIVAFMVVINIIPPKKVMEDNPFIVEKGELPMIAAHRGGTDNNPQNTMKAFREAVNNIGVDIIESDLYLTKDGYLVYNHNAYIDETCNINGDISFEEVLELCETEENKHYIEDMTLEEIQQYNFGYYFEDEDGNRPYKDAEDFKEQGLQIATVDQLFEEFYETNPELMFIVEIKNSEERGFEACKILSDTLDKYPRYREQIVVGTFHDEIAEELETKYSDLMSGASTGMAAKFVLTQYLRLNIFDNSSFACLQIPTSYDVGINVKLDSQTIIDRAHRRNIAVQFWTINDAPTMRKLIEMGVDCIMTDDPKLLNEVLDEYR